MVILKKFLYISFFNKSMDLKQNICSKVVVVKF